MRHRRPLAPGVLQEMYLNKTRKRLESMSAPDELLALGRHAGPVTINGREVPNISALWERLETEVDRLAENVQGCVVHGDLCLSNILYDLRSRVCKLVTRGCFGTTGLCGDRLTTGLYHSIYGLYDFITNDLFHGDCGTRVDSKFARGAADQRQFRSFSEFNRREFAHPGAVVRQHAGIALRRRSAQMAMYPGAGLFASCIRRQSPNKRPGAADADLHRLDGGFASFAGSKLCRFEPCPARSKTWQLRRRDITSSFAPPGT
jgi:hypothetical protein